MHPTGHIVVDIDRPRLQRVMRIGELLIDSGLITEKALSSALEYQRGSGSPLQIGQVLRILNFLTDGDLQLVLQAQRKIRTDGIDRQLAVAGLRLAKEKGVSFDAACSTVSEAVKIGYEVEPTKYASTAAGASKPSTPGFEESPERLLQQADHCLREQDWYRAIELCMQSKALMNRADGYDEADLVPVWEKLATAYQRLNKAPEAEQCHRQLYDTLVGLLGCGNSETAAAAKNLADFYLSTSRADAAEPLYKEALAGWGACSDKHSVDYLDALTKAILISRRSPREKQAKRVGELLVESKLISQEQFQQALQTSKRLRQPLGRTLVGCEFISDRELQSTLKLQILMRSGVVPAIYAPKLLHAAAVMQQSLEDLMQQQQLLPSNETPEGNELVQLIVLLDRLLLLENTVGIEHPDVADLAVKIADLSVRRNELDEAELTYQRAHAIYTKAGEEYRLRQAHACTKLARVYADRGKFAEAEPLLMESMQTKQRCLGDTHPEVANALIDVANLHYCQKNFFPALGFFRAALSMKEAQLGPESVQLRPLLEALYQCCLETGQDAMGEQFRERAEALG